MALCHVGRLYRDHLLLCELPLKRACNFSQFFVFKEEKRAPRSHEACHPGSSSLCHNAKHGLEVYNRYKELERRISSSAPHHRSRKTLEGQPREFCKRYLEVSYNPQQPQPGAHKRSYRERKC